MEDELKAAEADLARFEAEGDEEAVIRAQNRIDGLLNAMARADKAKTPKKKG